MRRLVSRAFMIAAAFLLLAELAIRVAAPDAFVGRFAYGYDAQAGFHEAGDGTVELRRTGGRKFWPQRFRASKPAGALRIVAVGDSIARGPSPEEAYPSQAAQRMRADGYTVESINLSIPGYGARRKALLLERALAYRPDVVVFQVGTSNEFEDERDWARYQAFEGWHPRNWPMKSELLRWAYELHSQQIFERLLPSAIRIRSMRSDAEDESAAGLDPRRREAWRRRFEEVTQDSLARAAAHGVPVVLIPRVVRVAGADRVWLDDEGVLDWCRRHAGPSVWVLDPADALGAPPPAEYFAGDRIHLRAPAHARIGDAIARLLERHFPRR